MKAKGFSSEEAVWLQALRLYDSVHHIIMRDEPLVLGYSVSKLTGGNILNQQSGKALREVDSKIDTIEQADRPKG